MLLNNFRKGVKLFPFLINSYSIEARDTGGNIRYISYIPYGFASMQILFGDGTTPATLNDFKLAGNAVTLDILSVALFDGIDSSGNPYLEKVIAASNRTASLKSVSEICSYGRVGYSTKKNGEYYQAADFLLERTVLSSPIVLEPSETVAIRYRVTSLIQEGIL